MIRTSVLRILNVIVGVVFLFSGLIKVLDVSDFQNLIIQYGLSFFQYLAPIIILLELFLGLALILGIMQKTAAVISICVLLVFTAAYTYGYLVNSVEDCGCFGNLVKSTPMILYIRNLVLITILVIVIFIDKNALYSVAPVAKWKIIILLSVMLPSIFAAGMTFVVKRNHNDIQPFEGMEVSKTPLKRYVEVDDKRKLVFFMSYQCQHCWNSIENYKAYLENGFVDTTLCYALSYTQSESDSVSLYFKKSYPEIRCQEVIRDSVSFIEATPTAFFIENNRIVKVVIGMVPSPFLLYKRK